MYLAAAVAAEEVARQLIQRGVCVGGEGGGVMRGSLGIGYGRSCVTVPCEIESLARCRAELCCEDCGKDGSEGALGRVILHVHV